MNLFRENTDLESLRDGTQEREGLYFSSQWLRASEHHQREGRHHSAVFKHPQNSKLFLTPYAYEYFQGALPEVLPKNCKVDNVVVVTDLDAKLWHWDYNGPAPHAFDDVTEGVYAEGGLRAGTDLWCFFEKAFVQNMRHTPKALFFNEQYSTALIVLSAMQSATYHLKQMSGIGILTETEFDSAEMHDAMMRHEWFHLGEDRHLSDLQIEIGADEAAIKGIQTPLLRQAWIDARVVGGFMWPFEGRQNGLALVDNDFHKPAYQEVQIKVMHEWCDAIFDEFFDPEVAAQLVSDMYNGQTIDVSLLPDIAKQHVEDRFYNKLFNDRKKISSAAEFKSWFSENENEAVSNAMWQYLSQSYLMRLQISNMRNSGFYGAMYRLSERVSPPLQGAKTIKSNIHERFRLSMKRLLPNIDSAVKGFTPEWHNIQVPGVNYRQGPYVG